MTRELTHLFIEFYDKLSSWEHSVVREADISLAQMHAIEVIGYYGKAQMKDVCEKLGITRGTLTVMINTLEKKGLVIKERNKDDSRSYHISLTPKAIELYDEHHNHHHDLIDNLLIDIEEEDKEQFKSVLQKILKNF